MQTLMITFVTMLAVGLMHFSYVDFRFRYRDGFKWFWMLNPAPPIMWAARATAVLAMLAAMSGPIVRINKTYLILVGVTVIVHLIILILLEVLEPR